MNDHRYGLIVDFCQVCTTGGEQRCGDCEAKKSDVKKRKSINDMMKTAFELEEHKCTKTKITPKNPKT